MGTYKISRSNRFVAACVAAIVALAFVPFLGGESRAYASDAITPDYSWYNDTDTDFILTSAEQFQAFANIVNNKTDAADAGMVSDDGMKVDTALPADDFLGKTVILTVDVDLGGVEEVAGGYDVGVWTDPVWIGNEWKPIGSYSVSDAAPGSNNGLKGRPFKGIFDGGFHTISNIYVPKPGTSDDNPYDNSHGIFGDLGQAGVVKNLILASGFIKGARGTAGIVGRSWGEVTNCANYATVCANGRGGGAGIVGMSYNNGHIPVVKDCANYGSIHNLKSSTAGSPYPGGIVAGNEGVIENCLNIGTVGSGGVAYGAILGERRGGTSNVKNCYFLDTSVANEKLAGTGTAGTVDTVSSKTAAEIQDLDFLATLGSAWDTGADGNPALKPTDIPPAFLNRFIKSGDPAKLSYTAGDFFDTAGLSVKVLTADYTMAEAVITCKPSGALTEDDDEVIVKATFGDKSEYLSYAVTVAPNTDAVDELDAIKSQLAEVQKKLQELDSGKIKSDSEKAAAETEKAKLVAEKADLQKQIDAAEQASFAIITPKLYKVTAGKKQATLTWKNVTDAQGYQIIYASDRSFTDRKTVNVASASQVKKAVKGLKGGKAYCFKLRGYMKIGDTTVYTSWSTSIKVKVKK
ncbi:MAG: hypothetical protein LBG82_04595 [Clostridiales Family XIII bacterium]|jgi:hypothetical protein|nr:hypothetical protein [Clostridiales Family XIII bacterium]